MSQLPEAAEMIKACRALDELEYNHTLSDEERRKAKAEQLEHYSQQSTQLFSKVKDDPNAPELKAYKDFSEKPENKVLFTDVQRSYDVAIGSKAPDSTIKISDERKKEGAEFLDTAGKLHLGTKLSTALKTSLAAFDAKNGKWDDERKEWPNYRSYEQMTSAEKTTLAEAVKRNGEAWHDLVESAKQQNGGVIPPEIKREYEREIENSKMLGMENEFKDRKVAESYPEATRGRRDSDGATLVEAKGLIGGMQEHTAQNDPDNGLNGKLVAAAKTSGRSAPG